MVKAKKAQKIVVDAKRAVKTASDYLRSIYDSEDISDIRLEGLQRSEKRQNLWFVTLSFSRFPAREFKRVDIDADTGEVKAMRMVRL